MKLSTLTAKLTETKAARALAITAAAAAALMIASPSAQAQHVTWGVSIGTPVYVDPAPQVVYQQPGYYYNGYNGDPYAAWRPHEQWEREQAWRQHEAHEQWERERAWRQHEAWEEHERREHMQPYGYGYGYRDYDRR
jgi:hypothetical protein